MQPDFTALGPSLGSIVRTQLDRLSAQGYRSLPCWITEGGQISPAYEVALSALLSYQPQDGEAIRKLSVLDRGPWRYEDAMRGDPDPALHMRIDDAAIAPDAVVVLSPTRKAWTERTAEAVHALVYHALVGAHRAAVAEASRLLGYPLDERTGYPEGYAPPAVPGRKKGYSADDYRRALEEAHGSVRGAAVRLGVSRTTVLDMIRVHGLGKR